MTAIAAEQGHPEPLRARSLEVRLAETQAEIEASQALRYRVFYEEMTARATPEMAAVKRDFDRFDDHCDHLLVLDLERGNGPQAVVATYRLHRRSVAEAHAGFYSIDEYDIAPLLAVPGELLELGRSCVDAAYRSGPVMQLLWRGIAGYVLHYDIPLMFGCASLPGTDLDKLALPLSYLFHEHLAPPEFCPRALAERYVDMNRMPAAVIERKAALAALPPLIKGYLRLGGWVGDGAVIDPQFDTTDVCVVVKTDQVTSRYDKHYRKQAGNDGDRG